MSLNSCTSNPPSPNVPVTEWSSKLGSSISWKKMLASCMSKYIGVILGLYKDNGKENGNYRDYRGYI